MARTKHAGTHAGTRGRASAAARRAGIAGAAVLWAAVVAAPAQAALSLTGPIDPVTAFPAWYQDSQGTQLALCVSPDPLCPAAPTADDLTATDGNGEAFYQLAQATATGPGGQSVTADFNLEAAFFAPGSGQQITFGRVQVGMTGMEGDSDYTVTSPYGTGIWHTDGAGRIIQNNRTAQRHQVGCAAVPCDFNVALGTEIGPFMHWDPAESPPPANHIGDGVTPHTIAGPAVTSLTVTGPGLPAGGISTDRFIVMGTLASPPAPIFFVAPGSGSFGTQRVGTTITRIVTVRNNGLATMPGFDAVAVTGAPSFAKGAPDTCLHASLASGATCTVQVSFAPTSATAQSGSLVLTEGGVAHTVALSGTGGQPGVSASPGLVNFLNQAVGTTGPERMLTIGNSGSVPLTITRATITGPQAAEFAVTSNGCTSIAVGASCVIGMQFLPSATGARNATLVIDSDAPGSPHNVPLTGNGTIVGGTQQAASTAATGAAPAAGAVAGSGETAVSAPAKLSLKSLATAALVKRSTAQRQGIRLTMGLRDGTEIVKINVYRKHGTRLQLLSTTFKVPSSGALYRASANQLRLRRLLKRGDYQVQVTPGHSKSDLGTTAKASFKVV